MAIYVSNIVIEQGFDFDTSFQLEDTRTKEFLDLTDVIPESKMRKTYSSSNAVSFASTITSPELGLVQISLTAAQTTAIKPGRYVYDVKLYSGDPVKEYKAVEGTVLVRAGVTR